MHPLPSPVAVHPASAICEMVVEESAAAVSNSVGVRGCSQEFTSSPPLGMPLPRAVGGVGWADPGGIGSVVALELPTKA